MISALDTAVSAMNAFGVGIQVNANNIANINTEGFKGSRVDYATRPYDSGVQVAAVLKDTSPGAHIPYAGGAGPVPIESSNTNLVREITSMITIQNAYAANAASVQVQDRMTGFMIDLVA